jgi:hemerythrin-like domain-containing protein
MTQIDESTRPRRPRNESATVTPTGAIGQRTLVGVHDHLRAELVRILEVIEQVAEQQLTPQQARELVNRTAMRRNHWTLGAFCASYCRVVSVHHTIEDQALFPTLRNADATLGPVLDRLGEEHEVIAGLLDALDSALVDLIAGRCEPAGVREAAGQLSDVLTSHLAYEEEELLGPIGEFSIVV